MEGAGIWIFLVIFYLLQAWSKSQQKKKRKQQQSSQEPKPKPQKAPTSARPRSDQPGYKPAGAPPQKSQRPVSLEDLFNPDKLRDILGVPQPEPSENPKPVPQPVSMRKPKPEIHKKWETPQQSKPSLKHEEVRETVSKVASADITDVDETAADFKGSRLGRSDITSEQFDQRKEAPGTKKPKVALEYFDEPKDIRNAIILKEVLDRPRAFRRNIR